MRRTTVKRPLDKIEKGKKATDDAMDPLAKIAFANMDDFARFKPDGSVEIFDYNKVLRAYPVE
jgi:hypothetical protein